MNNQEIEDHRNKILLTILIVACIIGFAAMISSCSKITMETPVKVYSDYVIQKRNGVEYHYKIIGYYNGYIPIIDSTYSVKVTR